MERDKTCKNQRDFAGLDLPSICAKILEIIHLASVV
jgi:hypothetical protein